MLKSPHLSVLSIAKSSAGFILFLVCSIAIYNKVISNEQWVNLKQVFVSDINSIPTLGWVILFLLMLSNLMIESIKWKIVVAENNPLKITTAFKSVMIGQAFAFFTPNRIGEYAGRTMFLSSGNKLLGLAQMAWTSYAQLFATICIGSVALFINLDYYPWLQDFWVIGFKVVIPILFLLSLFLYFFQHPWQGRLTFLNVIQINKRIKLKLIGWSLCKYSIFIAQYFWVSYLLQIQIPFFTIFLSLAIMFLLLSILPTLSITELVIRGQLLIMILAPFYTNKNTIVSLSSIIWGINFLLPAIMGTIFLLGFRLKK